MFKRSTLYLFAYKNTTLTSDVTFGPLFLVIYVRNKPAHGFHHLKNHQDGQKNQSRKFRFINTLNILTLSDCDGNSL